ncbi:hypothetical protein [Psychromonas ossibalaenae]|uniref:hypothetical protein n=1 Tax=Psychromonas ossibalaenae TaxID=444922 RepID=UPI000381D5D8|nr:hypothetical protein [Psychromonas ossibalaenae]
MNELNWIIVPLTLLAQGLSLFAVLTAVLYLLQRLVFSWMSANLGGRSVYISAVIGTPVHELSHALACIIFAHKIKKIVFFNPDGHGTLGYVNHSYNSLNPWQVLGNFFIGIAPLFGGLLVVYLLTLFLLPDGDSLLKLLALSGKNSLSDYSLSAVIELMSSLWIGLLKSYQREPLAVLLWFYLSASVSLHLSPSPEDLKGGLSGFLCFLLVIVLGHLCSSYFAVSYLNSLSLQHLGSWLNPIAVLYIICIVTALTLLMLMLLIKGFLLLIRS